MRNLFWLVLLLALLASPPRAEGPEETPALPLQVVVFEYDVFRCISVVSDGKFTTGATSIFCTINAASFIENLVPRGNVKPFRVISTEDLTIPQ